MYRYTMCFVPYCTLAEKRGDDFVEDILVNHYDDAYRLAAQRTGQGRTSLF